MGLNTCHILVRDLQDLRCGSVFNMGQRTREFSWLVLCMKKRRCTTFEVWPIQHYVHSIEQSSGLHWRQSLWKSKDYELPELETLFWEFFSVNFSAFNGRKFFHFHVFMPVMPVMPSKLSFLELYPKLNMEPRKRLRNSCPILSVLNKLDENWRKSGQLVSHFFQYLLSLGWKSSSWGMQSNHKKVNASRSGELLNLQSFPLAIELQAKWWWNDVGKCKCQEPRWDSRSSIAVDSVDLDSWPSHKITLDKIQWCTNCLKDMNASDAMWSMCLAQIEQCIATCIHGIHGIHDARHLWVCEV